MTAPGTLEQAVEQAQAGNRAAVESVIEQISGRVRALALRMLWHPEDARDAAQEILIRVITHLGEFRGASAFMTWVYRVAANHLSDMRKGRLELENYTFDRFGAELAEGLSDAPLENANRAEHALLCAEIRIGCTLGMLLCLDRPHRLAYILGAILELESGEAAKVLSITPAAFRKRLSRARAALVAFMQARCGLVNPANRCRCHRRVARALTARRVERGLLLFAQNAEEAAHFPEVLGTIRRLKESERAVALYRAQPEMAPGDGFTMWVRELLDRAISV